MDIKLKIAIPIIVVVLIAVGVMFASSNSVKTFVEIDTNANVLLKMNGSGKIVKVIPFDSNSQNILAEINVDEKDPLSFTKNYVEKAYELSYLTDEEQVNLLVASNNLEKDKQLISDLSALLANECTNQVNQYKVTKDDYKVINSIKADAKYTSFEIIEQGFTSKEPIPYITSIIYKNGSYYINFSKEVLFNGNEKVVCYALGQEYTTTPAGYNKNAMAVLVEDAPLDTTLAFDVSIKDYDNLEGICITPSNTEEEPEIEVEVSIDNEINQEKLDQIYDDIEEADISDKDRNDLLRQYEILQGSIDNLSTEEEINDFNIMYQNLVDSLEALTDEGEVAPSEAPSSEPTATNAPVATPTPTPAPTTAPTPTPAQTDFKTLNNNYYNQLNQYKAVVLSIQDQAQRETLNAEINQLYYKLSIATTQEDYDNFASGLATFEEHLRPYM